jgi:hypothetical protein
MKTVVVDGGMVVVRYATSHGPHVWYANYILAGQRVYLDFFGDGKTYEWNELEGLPSPWAVFRNVLPDRDCPTCLYHNASWRDGGWCYMFREEPPGALCGQYLAAGSAGAYPRGQHRG